MVAQTVAQVVNGKVVRATDFKPEMLQGLELLVVGSPIQGWRPSQPINAFLASLPPAGLKGIKIAAFDTGIKIFISGSAADKFAKKLTQLGGEPVGEPAAFYVKGKEGPLAPGELEK
ncbi:MAG: flavodoxin, partial [Syntrophales bacterium LBB04]|nr:flavodoxin [Syntrophales bacterium LBB04]